jgi:hypothetical protein
VGRAIKEVFEEIDQIRIGFRDVNKQVNSMIEFDGQHRSLDEWAAICSRTPGLKVIIGKFASLYERLDALGEELEALGLQIVVLPLHDEPKIYVFATVKN